MSSESGRPFGFGFVACFCLFFGGGLIYLGIKTTSSISAAIITSYGVLGISVVVIGICSAVMAVISLVRPSKAPTQSSLSENVTSPH